MSTPVQPPSRPYGGVPAQQGQPEAWPPAPPAGGGWPQQGWPTPAQPVQAPAPQVAPGFAVPTQQPGYAAPYQGISAPQFGQALNTPPRTARATLGWVALTLALVASVLCSAIAAIASVPIGTLLGERIVSSVPPAGYAWLSPVKTNVLFAETSFYVGTVLGLLGLILGIVAIRTKRGRNAGVWALVTSIAGIFIFAIAVTIALVLGATALS